MKLFQVVNFCKRSTASYKLYFNTRSHDSDIIARHLITTCISSQLFRNRQNCNQSLNKLDANKFHTTFHSYNAVMNSECGTFVGTKDRFNGITIDSCDEYDSKTMEEMLHKSLIYWSQNGKRCIWFKVQTKHSFWIPILTQNGFEFHHAKKGYVTMYKWLPKESPNLPPYAHTLIGVGGLVINDKNEILVVMERSPLVPNSWKLPGGYVEPNENLIDAVIREVNEETGVTCSFQTVVCLRHSHSGAFGCSDIYIVIALTPLNTNVKRCEREIQKVQWMSENEFMKHPNVYEGNKVFFRKYLDYKTTGIKFDFEKSLHPILKKEYLLYFMHQEAEQIEE